jgi:hypothetical protein
MRLYRKVAVTRKARFIDEQIIRILQEVNRDPVTAVMMQHSVSEAL